MKIKFTQPTIVVMKFTEASGVLGQTVREVSEIEMSNADIDWRRGEDDRPLLEDALIAQAHPLDSGEHALFSRALQLVGARRSKFGLVELVNWLLVENKKLQQKLIETEREVGRLKSERAEDAATRIKLEKRARREIETWKKAKFASEDHIMKCQKEIERLESELRLATTSNKERAKELSEIYDAMGLGTLDAGDRSVDGVKGWLFVTRNALKHAQAFKAYVHGRLDKMGIAFDPEPENNTKHGCRIEGRLNVVEQMKQAAEVVVKGFQWGATHPGIGRLQSLLKL